MFSSRKKCFVCALRAYSGLLTLQINSPWKPPAAKRLSFTVMVLIFPWTRADLPAYPAQCGRTVDQRLTEIPTIEDYHIALW